ncbi:MAG: diaminobutyrate acetyltransferase [Myxococcota bacterium]|nr:diaminobutyrate acetyltransferase [Myxococcota bacterium]
MRELIPTRPEGIEIRAARPEDGAAIHALVERCGTLELNTPYAYVLLADHFAGTSIVATSGDALVGTVVGYRPPTHPDAVFVWQVGVDPSMRGRRLGVALLDAFTRTPEARSARFLEATVSPSNTASRALFAAFARGRGAELAIEPGYAASLFPAGHEPEQLLRIGPLSTDPRGVLR